MKKWLVLAFLALVGSALAHEHSEMANLDAKYLVYSGEGCENFSKDELMVIGDYYMEQVHPGFAHKVVHSMLGGDDSETLHNLHIHIAKVWHCMEPGNGITGWFEMTLREKVVKGNKDRFFRVGNMIWKVFLASISIALVYILFKAYPKVKMRMRMYRKKWKSA